MLSKIESSVGLYKESSVPFITINLCDSNPFDADKFDQLVQDNFLETYGRGMFTLKHITYGDIMHIFPDSILHSKALVVLRNLASKGNIQSAAEVTIVIRPSFIRRVIEGYSIGLSANGELDRRDSDMYKNTVIKAKIGDYFEVK